MATSNIGQLVSGAWHAAMRETPDPFDFRGKAYGEGHTYRQMLDYQPRNGFGDLIPRIVTVRHNLYIFKAGNIMQWRGLNVQDRRQQPQDRRRVQHDLLIAAQRALNDRMYREWPEVAEMLMAAIRNAGGSID